jgi:hypothetical protein
MEALIFRGGYSYRKKGERKLTGTRLSVRIANVYNRLVRLPPLSIQIEKKEREEWPFHFPRWLLLRSTCSPRS